MLNPVSGQKGMSDELSGLLADYNAGQLWDLWEDVDHVPFPTLELCEATVKRIDELYTGEKTLLCVQATGATSPQ
jgi:hypothetical protein